MTTRSVQAHGFTEGPGFINAGVVKVWDVERGETLATLEIKDERVLCAASSPDGKTIASGGDWTGKLDARTFGTVGRLRLWSVESGKLLHKLEPEEKEGSIRGLAFSPDGKVLAAGSDDTALRLWDTATAKHVRKLHARTSMARALPAAGRPVQPEADAAT